MFQPFDDMTEPIKFDIDENDEKFGGMFDEHNQNVNNEWLLDLEDFYGEYFNQADIFVILEQDQKFSFGGPLILDTPEGE